MNCTRIRIIVCAYLKEQLLWAELRFRRKEAQFHCPVGSEEASYRGLRSSLLVMVSVNPE